MNNDICDNNRNGEYVELSSWFGGVLIKAIFVLAKMAFLLFGVFGLFRVFLILIDGWVWDDVVEEMLFFLPVLLVSLSFLLIFGYISKRTNCVKKNLNNGSVYIDSHSYFDNEIVFVGEIILFNITVGIFKHEGFFQFVVPKSFFSYIPLSYHSKPRNTYLVQIFKSKKTGSESNCF